MIESECACETEYECVGVCVGLSGEVMCDCVWVRRRESEYKWA